MTKRKNEGALGTLAYVQGWRQNSDGRWFKPGVAGTYDRPSEAFKAEETYVVDPWRRDNPYPQGGK